MRPRTAFGAALGVVFAGGVAWHVAVPEWPAWRALVVPVMLGACIVGYSLADRLAGHGDAAALLCVSTFGFMLAIETPWGAVGYVLTVVPGLVLGVADMTDKIRDGLGRSHEHETPA